MDWLDEKIDILGRWLHNLSLRKALIAYIVICVISFISLYALTMFLCEKQEKRIWSKYTEDTEEITTFVIVNIKDTSMLTENERIIVQVIDFIQSWCIFIYSFAGIIGVSILFYQKKMKPPLLLLKEATARVADNNLDLDIRYDSKDEMGDLCRSFDFMRKQLIMNNKAMWDLMEEQKRLNAAFAHDLRTPLTVLKGYADFLTEYLPQGKISEEKLMSTLSMMTGNIERLERYSNTMKEIQSFEELPVNRTCITLGALKSRLDELISVFHGRNNIAVKLSCAKGEGTDFLYLDEAILMEVFENLISNALRYARTEILVTLVFSEEEHQLLLSVSDDGKGFEPGELILATKPYYSDSSKRKTEHFGIGLYIGKLLSEKHGGWITLYNGMKGGAAITAAFDVDQAAGC